jgi:VWFA-related protein
MKNPDGRSPLSILVVTVFMAACVAAMAAPSAAQTKPTDSDDSVIRVKTELVQTDLTVVDKHGKFVEGLSPEQFQLRIDGKPRPLAFLDEIVTGSAAEETQLKASRAARSAASTETGPATNATNRTRVVFFFVDDVHLAGDSLSRARSLLTHFVENKMAAGDRVAIISASGQIGFLQQLTDNKAVLREAINRIHAQFNPETSASQVHISEVDANLVGNHADRGLFNYLVVATMREYQMWAINAVTMVKNRVEQVNSQAKQAEHETLSSLESFIQSTAPLAGRKTIFFVSDGFVVDTKRSNGLEVMQRIGKEAARVGAVIYTMDTRANFFGPGADVSKNDFPDLGGGTAWRSLMENKGPHEPLETLADETGGRSYLNSNALDEGLGQALAESAAYYLLAWRPDSEDQRSGKSRIEVTIKDRPDLRVRMRRHAFDFKPTETRRSPALPESPDEDIRSALASLYPRTDLPTSVSATIAKNEKGSLVTIGMQLDSEMINFDSNGQGVVDVLGTALDDRGLFASFKQRLEIPRQAASAGNRYIKWTQVLTLAPGLYQVRVATRDRGSARTGSAMMWIEVPRSAETPARP